MIDEETQQVLVEYQKIKETMATEGWAILRERLQKKIDFLASIDSIDQTKDTTEQIKIHTKTRDVLKSFLIDLDEYASYCSQYVTIVTEEQ